MTEIRDVKYFYMTSNITAILKLFYLISFSDCFKYLTGNAHKKRLPIFSFTLSTNYKACLLYYSFSSIRESFFRQICSKSCEMRKSMPKISHFFYHVKMLLLKIWSSQKKFKHSVPALLPSYKLCNVTMKIS